MNQKNIRDLVSISHSTSPCISGLDATLMIVFSTEHYSHSGSVLSDQQVQAQNRITISMTETEGKIRTGSCEQQGAGDIAE